LRSGAVLAGSGYANGMTHDQVITSAVERVSPSVVSIIISKEVPKLEVIYDNPFGDRFRNFDFKFPFFRENGSEEQQVGAGSGFIVSSDGYIVTNKHVIEDDEAEYTAVFSDGRLQPAHVIYKDPSQDIAIIKVEGNYTPVELGDSSSLKIGQTVIAIGNALGEYNNSVSTGIISGLDRSIHALNERGGGEELTGVIQTDAAINRGNSGGPLVNGQGQVIGVNVATVVGSSNISFAIPIDEVKGLLRNMFSI
jgi:serine protease Do